MPRARSALAPVDFSLHRYTDDAIDLCDVLSSFSSQAKATLHELCRVMGLPGKPDGMTGAEVEKYYRDGHIREIAESVRPAFFFVRRLDEYREKGAIITG